MKSSIHSFKSFVGAKPLFLLENKEEQIEKLELYRRNDIIETIGKYKWSEEKQAIDFDELVITYRFREKSLDALPFRIGSCVRFILSGTRIKDLKGLPSEVEEIMDISLGDLKSLEGCPEIVPDFNVEYNLINSLKSGPKFVGGNFNLQNNLLENLDNGPYIILGKPKLSYNPKIEGMRVDNMSIATLFNKMHEDIARMYAFDKNGEPINSSKIIFQNVAKAIEDKIYSSEILLKNPDYKIFLSDFSELNKDWDFLQDIKDFGFFQ